MGNRPKQKGLTLHEVFYKPGGHPLKAEQWFPSLDLFETPAEIVIRLEVPGVRPEDLRVWLEGAVLRVEGVKREPELPEAEKVCFLCLERGYGPFQKTIELQWVIDPHRAAARLQNGVLTIHLFKMEDRRGRGYEIPVTAEADV